MPSLPTSLIVVGLVVAWIVVLVPMVARRREEVPENADDSPRIRILGRGTRVGRRRAVLSRTAMAHRTRPDSPDVEVAEHDGDDVELGGAATHAIDDESGAVAGDTSHVDDDSASDPINSAAGVDALAQSDNQAELSTPEGDTVPHGAERVRGSEPTGSGFDDTTQDRATAASTARRARRDLSADAPMRGPMNPEPDDETYRRVPMRPGRGGYDPVAARQASDYRFRQRRRVALALTLIVALGTAGGMLHFGYGYPMAVGGGVLLTLYFAYLRRQVRIEDEIQQRRAARLERARQIRPGYRPSVAEQVYAHRTGEIPRPGFDDGYRVRSHARQTVPATTYGYGQPVDVEDSDPAFDDLEYYRPAALNRRAG